MVACKKNKTSEKLKWKLMGVSSERGLRCDFPWHCSKLSSFLDNIGAVYVLDGAFKYIYFFISIITS